jgi:hypothetical protein
MLVPHPRPRDASEAIPRTLSSPFRGVAPRHARGRTQAEPAAVRSTRRPKPSTPARSLAPTPPIFRTLDQRVQRPVVLPDRFATLPVGRRPYHSVGAACGALIGRPPALVVGGVLLRSSRLVIDRITGQGRRRQSVVCSGRCSSTHALVTHTSQLAQKAVSRLLSNSLFSAGVVPVARAARSQLLTDPLLPLAAKMVGAAHPPLDSPSLLFSNFTAASRAISLPPKQRTCH